MGVTRPASGKQAVRHAVERSLSAYTRLDCGHLSTRQRTLAYAAWAPPGAPHFCEECAAYQPVRRQPGPRGHYPEIPPF